MLPPDYHPHSISRCSPTWKVSEPSLVGFLWRPKHDWSNHWLLMTNSAPAPIPFLSGKLGRQWGWKFPPSNHRVGPPGHQPPPRQPSRRPQAPVLLLINEKTSSQDSKAFRCCVSFWKLKFFFLIKSNFSSDFLFGSCFLDPNKTAYSKLSKDFLLGFFQKFHNSGFTFRTIIFLSYSLFEVLGLLKHKDFQGRVTEILDILHISIK